MRAYSREPQNPHAEVALSDITTRFKDQKRPSVDRVPAIRSSVGGVKNAHLVAFRGERPPRTPSSDVGTRGAMAQGGTQQAGPSAKRHQQPYQWRYPVV